MAEFVYHNESPQTLDFNNFQIELIWSIEDTTEQKINKFGSVIGGVGNTATGFIKGMTMNEKEISDLVEKAGKLEEEKI